MAVLVGCEQTPSTPVPPLSRTAPGELSRIAVSAIDADRQLIHSVVVAATHDGIANADQWFGARKNRTQASICRGLERLIAKHLVTYEQAKHRSRTPAARAARAAEIVRGSGCGQPAPMMMFGSAMALRVAAPPPMPDEVDDWFAANWHEDFWTGRVNAWADAGIMFIDPYISGMTDYEVAKFQSVQCAAMYAVNDIANTEGESMMMMYFIPGWMKAALAGCAATVITSIPEIVTGAKLGFALGGGPGGAALAATAVAGEMCIYGAVAGYVGYKIGSP
jgi:hypothetical protein